MEMTQLLPELQSLNHTEQLYIMQFPVAELAHEAGEGDRSGVTYPSGFTPVRTTGSCSPGGGRCTSRERYG